jgi:hypothetical protein
MLDAIKQGKGNQVEMAMSKYTMSKTQEKLIKEALEK